MQSKYLDIEKKVERGERLTYEDGVALFASHDIAWLGALADHVRAEKCGDIVYYNVNCHVNLTNICMAHCKFCAFGRDAEDAGAYEMSAAEAVAHVAEAMRDPHLAGLHVVSGLHPTWTFDDYLLRLRTLHEAFPSLYLKGFTGGELCPNKATADEWLAVARTAHELDIKTNASMLYGHIETLEERVAHMMRLRDLQDETGGFQTFIPFPFLPSHTELGRTVRQTSMWDDLRTIAIARLLLDNFRNIKAYWVMLTVPVAQVALGFGANDIDGTVHKETILHDAGAKSPRALSEDHIIRIIREIGRTPAACDSNFNIIETY